MFDLRYHLASLAAVFIAIAVGIVIGVAIASGGSLEEATQALQEERIKSLETELSAAQANVDGLEGQQRAIAEVMGDVYPTLVADRLADTRVAVLSIGPVNGTIRSSVERTLSDAGAGASATNTVLSLPIDTAALDDLLGSDPRFQQYVGEGQLDDLGAALAREIAVGGEAPLWDLLANQLVEERSGAFPSPVGGVVVSRSWWPESPGDAPLDDQDRQTEEFLTGLLDELGRLSVPTVGVEASASDPSGIELYRETGTLECRQRRHAPRPSRSRARSRRRRAGPLRDQGLRGSRSCLRSSQSRSGRSRRLAASHGRASLDSDRCSRRARSDRAPGGAPARGFSRGYDHRCRRRLARRNRG